MKVKSILVSILGFTIAILLIAFVGVGNEGREVKKIIITIDNQLNNHFVDDNDVLDMITGDAGQPIIGTAYRNINVRTLENRVRQSEYIEDAEIFRDLKGNLMVKVLLRRPVARVIQYQGPDAYIAEDGTILPVSEKFTARVLLISGAGAKDIVTSEKITKSAHAALFNLIEYINADEFWKAQIAQIEMLESGEIHLLPQVTKQIIEFGDLQDIEDKFNRLEIFYHDILPRKGWNTYSRVSVKYKDQIICE